MNFISENNVSHLIIVPHFASRFLNENNYKTLHKYCALILIKNTNYNSFKTKSNLIEQLKQYEKYCSSKIN